MDFTQRAEITSRIKKEITKTEEVIVEYKEVTQPISPENAIGRVSRMDAINNKSVMEAALRTARKELEDLEHASRYISMDDFGKCDICGNMINVKRLMVMPGSRHCMKCAQ